MENQVEKTEKAKESSGIKMILRGTVTPSKQSRRLTGPSARARTRQVVARASPTNPTPIQTPPTTKAKLVRKLVVESHLGVLNVEKK